jgi:hypothetical protein
MDADNEIPAPPYGSSVGRNSGGNAFKSTLTGPLLVAAAYDDGCVTVWEIMINANTTTMKHRFWPNCAKNNIHDAVRSYTAEIVIIYVVYL